VLTHQTIAAYPGKTIADKYHPALWHMLDVGAVATTVAERQPLTECPAWNQALIALIALHDIGKISAAFQAQITRQAGRSMPHSQCSFALFTMHDDLFEAALGGDKNQREQLYAAVAGHHGGPPRHEDRRQRHKSKKAIGEEAQAVARDMMAAVLDLFPDATLNGLPDAEALSWRLSGATVQADWIGSNVDWFGVKPPDIPIEDYWAQTQQHAKTAIEEAGLHHATPKEQAEILPDDTDPRPMQQATKQAPLPKGPTLALIEDATGSGKTEAALILAHRLIAAGKAQGIFFALPTMATSNAMYERIAKIAPRLFTGKPSLGLSHGRAKHNPHFQRIKGNAGSDPDEPVTCGQWLADDRRLILLADIAVGTIDQALLAVLPTRFNTLRLWGLSSKVLIVDEAHAYDPYMERELSHLLRFHAMLGGSAILMTATLPQRMRDHYVAQFQKGLGMPAAQTKTPLTTAYPALTVLSKTATAREVDPVPATRRTIAVRRIEPRNALEILADGVKRNAACVWIRNSVDEAIEAVQDLEKRGIAADLLHARFTVADRLEKEEALQKRFGKDGTNRAGRVLVATQVVEASLDLDFDLMISDLAPIGTLIQRSGRLWRHMDRHPKSDRPLPDPVLHVVSPDPEKVENEKWLRNMFPAGAWVYPLADQWRTAQALFTAGQIHAPDGLRKLIEAVHGPDSKPVPATLENAEIETEGKVFCERAMANNLLLPPEGYLHAAQKVYDEDRILTRLGIPQITLRLARQGPDGLHPYAASWEESEVSLSRSRYEKLGGIDQNCPKIAAIKQSWPEWQRKTLDIAPVNPDGEISDGLRYDAQFGLVARPKP